MCDTAPALAQDVACGQELTASTTLDSDLSCPGAGLKIGSNDITLDLDGHRIIGAGTGVGIDNGGFTGPGHNGVTIKNGTVAQFHLGVRVTGASGNHLTGLRVSESDGSGIVLFRDAKDNVVEQNLLLHDGNGISLDGASANKISGNSSLQNTRGIALFDAPGNRIENNTAGSNALMGIFLFNSPKNVVFANKARTAKLGSGISVTNASDDSVVDANVTDRNGIHGIELAEVTRVLVSNNTSSQNGVDGIQVNDVGSTVTGNTADANGNLGIDAVLGVLDGGGNLASGNGNPAQCTYVVCVRLPAPAPPPAVNPPLVALPTFAPPPATHITRSRSRCSTRAALQTLSDSRAGLVSFEPRLTTVSRLQRARAPRAEGQTPRVEGVETTTYKLKARLVGVRKDHGDIRLLVSDRTRGSRKMMVVFPFLGCTSGVSSPRREQIMNARAKLIRACGSVSSSFRRLRGRAAVTGVGLLVRRASSNQRANGIELNPALSFQSAGCRRG